jgi:hypothetical protein
MDTSATPMGLSAAGRRAKTRYRHMDRAKAEAIRKAYFSRQAKQAELAAAYGVKQNTISRIVSGLVWAMSDGQRGDTTVRQMRRGART